MRVFKSSIRLGVLRSAMALILLCVCTQAGSIAPGVSILLSLPDKLERQALEQIEQVFDNAKNPVNVYLPEQFESLASGSSTAQDIVVAAGRQSCEYAAQNLQQQHVLCVLVSVESFERILANRVARTPAQRFSAIVIDQPLERQVRIASKVFPSLRKFAVLTSGQSQLLPDSATHSINGSTVKVDQFDKAHAVAPQVVNTLNGQDALVAISDSNVYTSERLRTVLLTAYGYAKPVIGYSRAYVRAGALITTFTTLEQVFRQTAEILNGFAEDSERNQTYDPHYFSIMDNPSIAKSLGLVQRFHYRQGYDYVDRDFSS